ncbi:MAG: class I SAM-dependent methyltransferase [Verrucomicrobia bacterium]|nr:class I SAM-dependent methyltransferase [Verrucomicrobiota bacterium]
MSSPWMNRGEGSAPEASPGPPCVVFEDDDLLVVHKPPGWNTHAPAPYSGEGIHEWLKHREPRWARLAIVHRLDKDTSGLLVFGKTPEANRSLTGQFARREVHKHYLCVTDRPVAQESLTVRSGMVRMGDRHAIAPEGTGDRAETRFRMVRREGAKTWMEAEPVTGRTHQIRVHAASRGWPLLGDRLYGGSPASRLYLHAARLALGHPRDGRPMAWEAPVEFARPPAAALRAGILREAETSVWRAIHGAADGCPGSYLEMWADSLLIESEQAPPGGNEASLRSWIRSVAGDEAAGASRICFKALRRQVRQTDPADASPRLLAGPPAPPRFGIRENGVRFEAGFAEGYSTGLFPDQRDNRRRLLTGHVAADFPALTPPAAGAAVLNTFAYTCAFSVCAALRGCRTTSLDLSRKYLEWGRRHFELNGLDPGGHEFIHGDVFEWLDRLRRKGRQFQVVILDPPTFSRSREHGDFRADADYGDLVSRALPLLAAEGVLLASTNAARWAPADFLKAVHGAIQAAGRRVTHEHYAPQPPDFPVTRDEPAYLKTVWMRIR